DAARPAAALALLYLANPSLHGINIRDIHPQAFAVPFLVWAAAAFDAQRYGLCVLALVLTLGGREDAAIAVVGFGLWLALARRRWALGAAVVAVSVLVLLVDLTWVMPYFRGSPYPHLDRYRHLGASVPEILVTLVARPWRWAPIVLTLPKLAYLAAMLAPLGFLPLLAPRALAAALPGLAMNLLSFDPVLFNYRSQYQSFVLPFFVLASVDGYARLRQWRGSRAEAGGGVRAWTRAAGSSAAWGRWRRRRPLDSPFTVARTAGSCCGDQTNSSAGASTAPFEASPKDSCAGKAGARRAAVEQRIVRRLD